MRIKLPRALSGGDGIDTLSYGASLSRVIVSLMGSAAGGDATGDTFTGFENIIGTRFDDRLTGDAGANVLSGGFGNDTLIGSTGSRLVATLHGALGSFSHSDFLIV